MSLAVDNLRVYYRTLRGDVKALDGVTFGVADGEIMGIAGESGCGKTTLGKSLIRLDGRMRVVEGTVTLDGVRMPIENDRAMNEYRFRDVSIVPQYAMSALNPIRKIGRMISELLAVTRSLATTRRSPSSAAAWRSSAWATTSSTGIRSSSRAG